jgi:hypothetical protein
VAPGRPPPSPAAPEDKPRAYAARIDDDDDDDDEDDDDGFGGEYPPLVALAGVRGVRMQITRVHLAGMQNPGISKDCRLGLSGRMETSVVWTLDHRHHVARLDSTPCTAARGWIAPAGVPLDSRQVRLPPKKLLVRTV